MSTVLDPSSLTVAILAGGLGTRIRTVVSDRPKVLAEVQGRPFLTRLLDQLSAAGFQRVVLCTGHLGDQVRAAFGESYEGLRLLSSQESSPLGTAGALRLAQPLCGTGPVLVMNGDSFCDVDMRAFLAWYCEREATCALVLARMDDTRRFGQVHVDIDGRVLRFEEKNDAGGPGWINAGVYLIAPDLLRTIPAGRAASLEREMFPAWIGHGLSGYRSEGRFLDIGTPEAYASAESFFAPGG